VSDKPSISIEIKERTMYNGEVTTPFWSVELHSTRPHQITYSKIYDGINTYPQLLEIVTNEIQRIFNHIPIYKEDDHGNKTVYDGVRLKYPFNVEVVPYDG